MELRQLNVFYKTAKLGSLSKASEELNLTQPAASISLNKLEEELGVKLFIREGRKLIISQEGKEILPIVEKMLFLENEVLDLFKGNRKDTIELKILTRAAYPFLVDVISNFHHDWPNVNIVFLHDKTANEYPDILVDASVFNPQIGIVKNKDREIIYEENIVLAVPRILKPICPNPFSLEELMEYELIGLNKNYALGEIEDYYINYYNLDLHHSITCDNSFVMRNFLMNGTGVAFVPSKTWLWQKNVALSLVPFEIGNWTRYVRIKPTHYREYNKKVADIFMEYIKKGLREL